MSSKRGWWERFNRINIWPIITEHFRRLRDYETGENTPADYTLFGLLPIVASTFFFWSAPYVSKDAMSMVATAVSILGGLLFQLLVLIYTLAGKVRSTPFPDGVDPHDPEETRIKN